jgi:hypothetical protein
MGPVEEAPISQLVSRAELRRLIRDRKVIIVPLLDERAQIDHMALDLRLDFFASLPTSVRLAS